MWALISAALFCNLFLRRILNVFETLGGVCHILFFVVIVVILTTLAERSSSDFVFNTLTYDLSGWSNPAICFNIGLLPTLLPILGADSILHMSKSPLYEEQTCLLSRSHECAPVQVET